MSIRRVEESLVRIVALIAVAGLSGCDSPSVELSDARRLYTGTDSMGIEVSARTIPVHARSDLIENSGATMSVSQPGVIFTINDSGHEPVLFVLDTTGADRGAWRVVGASNVDWEAIASGPCGGMPNAELEKSSPRCIYIGDVGDNDAVRPSVTVYKLREPRADSAGALSEIAAESLSFTYEEGRHDVEAMFVAPNGSVNLITKRPHRTLFGRLRPALIFAIPAAAWGHGPVVARRVDSLGIVPGSAPNRVITDASLSRDARYLAVRTYWQVYIFAYEPAASRIFSAVPDVVCNIASLRERQGEGISWYLDTGQLLLTSEGSPEPFRIINCPLIPAGLDSVPRKARAH